MSPLIVTATLDRDSWRYFEGLRRAHFPPERNVLAAHLTLFHHLPGEREAAIGADLAAAAGACKPMAARAARARSLGGGVAIDIDCGDLLELRARLAARWVDLLGRQDRAWRRPH